MNKSRLWKLVQISTVTVPILLLALLFTPNSLAAQQDKERTWTDSSGEYRIKATLMETDGTDVVLRKSDGKTVTLKIARLSKTDQTWLNNRKAGNANAKKPSVGKRGVVDIDSRESRQLKSRRVEPWSLTADASIVEPLVYSSDGISMGITGRLIGTQAAFSRQRELAVFSYHQEFFTWFKVVNLVTGTEVGSTSLERVPPAHVHDVSPDGLNLLCGYRGWQQFSDNKIDILELRKGKVANRIQFTPHPDLKMPANGLQFARFVNDERVVSCNRVGTIAMWDFRFAKLLWWLETESEVLPGMSANGKYLAVYQDEMLTVVDLEQGEIAATRRVESHGLKGLAISPDGTKIAGVGVGLLRTWDFATGELIDEMDAVSATNVTRMKWSDNRHVLISDLGPVTFYDTELCIPIWQFVQDLRADFVVDSDQQVWYWDPSSTERLRPFKFPTVQTSEEISGKTKQDYIALERGEAVRVEYRFQNFNSEIKANIRKNFDRKLSDAGFRISNSASKVMRVWAGIGDAIKDEDGRTGRQIDFKMPGFRHTKTQFYMVALYDENNEYIWTAPHADVGEAGSDNGRYFERVYIPGTLRKRVPNTLQRNKLGESANDGRGGFGRGGRGVRPPGFPGGAGRGGRGGPPPGFPGRPGDDKKDKDDGL